MMKKDIADRGMRIAEWKNRPIQNRHRSEWLDKANRYLVGGVNSPVRAFRHVGSRPLMLTRSQGAEVVDTHGRRYLDFIMGWGALILGHQPPVVRQALTRQLKRGVMLGLTHPAEVELARLITEAVPSVEQVRFTVSGTEACLTAIKLARAHTGRMKILVCAGGYHGHGESLMAGQSAGIPASLARERIAIPWNDDGALAAVFQRHGAEIAAAIVEPVSANIGVIAPQPGYLARLRALTRTHDALLIFDEVVTGFRLSYGGAQAGFRIRPDLTTFGKIIGGGLPIGAVGGPRSVMRRLAPEGDVYHGGTFAGHPLSMAAGVATLRQLRAHPPYRRLERLAMQLADGLRAVARRRTVAVQVHQMGSMLTVFFSASTVRQAAHAQASRRTHFARWANALRQANILIPPSPLEAWFLSTAHTERHVRRFLRAADTAFRTLAAGTNGAM